MNLRLTGLAALALAVGAAGCGNKQPETLGAPLPAGAAAAVAIRDLKTGDKVVIRGSMIEKCPVAGCWFILRDKTGQIKVDTKAAGFVVSEVPLNTTVTAAGLVKNSGEKLVAATGIQYGGSSGAQ